MDSMGLGSGLELGDEGLTGWRVDSLEGSGIQRHDIDSAGLG
jgi:hypothetical protein